MKIQKRLTSLFLAMVMLFAMSVMTYAHEVPDTVKMGSLSVTMSYDGKAVPGGTLMLYRVGEIHEDDGSYSFVLTEAFADSSVSLDDLSSATLADTLAAYAASHGLTGTAVKIGDDGKATAGGLMLGLYLVVQTTAADGYEAVAPFVVSVPMNENGTYIYDVDATPKMSALTESTPDTPTTPTTRTTSNMRTTRTTPSEPTLPQTGQLNWPVPVMVVLGLCLFLTGWALRYGRKEQPHEA